MIKSIFKLLVVALIVNTNLNAQCNTFTKLKCYPKLKPYINTQQLANTVLEDIQKGVSNPHDPSTLNLLSRI